ncbi:MAG: DsbA family protein [Steroidobacteraceae bacterium]
MQKIHFLLCFATLILECVPILVPAQEIQRITTVGQKEMLTNPGIDLVGSANADVTIVEYFDYNCPYCKKLVPTFQALLAQDHKIAIIYKDWPILGGVSVYAAKSALAAQWQGKYLVAHDALISGPRLAQESQVDAALQRAGVNLDTLKKDQISRARDIDALLSRNNAEARALGLRGTPGIVVGRQLLPGVADLTTLQQVVDESRRDK